MAWNPAWANAIASIESQGSGGYSAVGPTTAKGNRAYGKYQVMDFNIPAWTEKHLGQRLTPEQFLASPEAQDAVFQGEFGSSVQKYGNPQDAASVWFTGRPASQGAGRSDILGTTGADYVNKFNAALGQGPQTSTKGPQMMQEQKPQGLLGSLGIQKRDEAAGGETAQPFYQRDTFKDTAAVLAQGFGRMGIMGMEEIADDIAKQRTENKARNKTAEYLRKAGRTDLADMVDQGLIGGREAAGVLLQKPDEKGQVVSAAQLREMYPGSEIADGLYNLKKDNTITKVGGAPQVVVNSGDKGANKFAELDAKTLVDVASTGMQAQRSLGQINRLESLLEGVPTGAQGAIKLLAGNFGIKTEGLDDLQAAQALINSLVPQQRPPGSGPMSDADLELFKQSLPRIINSPNGNQIILETMRGVAQYDKMGADIVQRYRSGEITQAQAFAELGARPDPFAGLNLGAPAQQGGGMTPEDAAKLLEGL